MDGDLTQRAAASRLGVHPVEGKTVMAALRDVVEDAATYDPYLKLPGEMADQRTEVPPGSTVIIDSSVLFAMDGPTNEPVGVINPHGVASHINSRTAGNINEH